MKKLLLISLLACLIVEEKVQAQELPAFKPLRYDEDYSFLEKDTASDFYARMKFVPLLPGRKAYLSYGGDFRFQYFYTKKRSLG